MAMVDGDDQDTINANIAQLRREGHPEASAIRQAHAHARSAAQVVDDLKTIRSGSMPTGKTTITIEHDGTPHAKNRTSSEKGEFVGGPKAVQDEYVRRKQLAANEDTALEATRRNMAADTFRRTYDEAPGAPPAARYGRTDVNLPNEKKKK